MSFEDADHLSMPGSAGEASQGATTARRWVAVASIARRLGDVGPSLLVTLGAFLLLLATSSELLNDPDSQWHVAVGRWIWAQGRVPTTDVFSHTFFGAPWIAKEWISQMILFAAYQVDAWRGVVLVAALAIAVAYGLLFDWLRRRVRLSVAIAATAIALALAAPHLLARPHVLVFPIIVLWTTGLVTATEKRTTPPLALALLMVLWVNMHGTFPVGIVIAGVLACDGVLGAGRSSRPAALRRWGLFLAVACAATLVSPYGWDAILIPLHMGHNVALRFVAEWQPLAFDANGLLALGLLVLSLAVLVSDLRANVFRLAALLLLGALMVKHARFIDIFAIAAPILCAQTLAKRWHLGPEIERKPGMACGLAVGTLGLCIVAAVAMIAPKPNAGMAPNAAYRAAMAKGLSGPVYNDYDFGGFLIAHGVKTFVDGRTDQLFLGDFLPALEQALDAKDDAAFAGFLTRHHVTWALVRSKSQDAAHLAAMPGWSKVFGDEVASVFAMSQEPRATTDRQALLRDRTANLTLQRSDRAGHRPR